MHHLPTINQFVDCESKAKNVVKSLNQNELKSLMGEILGANFWYKKKAPFSKANSKLIAFQKRIYLYIRKLLKCENCPVEVNENGVRIDRAHVLMTAAEYSNQLFKDRNWRQFLYLESYHQYWINEKTLEIICFIEGDLVTRTAADKEMLEVEMLQIKHWYKENY